MVLATKEIRYVIEGDLYLKESRQMTWKKRRELKDLESKRGLERKDSNCIWVDGVNYVKWIASGDRAEKDHCVGQRLQSDSERNVKEWNARQEDRRQLMEGFLMSENGSFGRRVMRKHIYKGEEKIWQRGGSEPQNVPMQTETGGNQEQRWKGCPCKTHSDFHRSPKSRRLLKIHFHVPLDSKACFPSFSFCFLPLPQPFASLAPSPNCILA